MVNTEKFYVFVAFLYNFNFQGCILSETLFSKGCWAVWMDSIPDSRGFQVQAFGGCIFVLKRRWATHHAEVKEASGLLFSTTGEFRLQVDNAFY